MKLWFENLNRKVNQRRVICDCDTWAEVCKSINEFVAQCNEAKPQNANPFKIYYMRVWEEDGMTKIDVGSHTEFFYWEGEYPFDDEQPYRKKEE